MATVKRTKLLARAARACSLGMAVAWVAWMPSVLQGVESVATHKQIRSIVPRWKDALVHLNTFCVGPDNLLHLCCGPATSATGSNVGVILVYTGDGELVRDIPLNFVPQAINFASDGKCFVAGSGHIARLSAEGVVEIVKDAPNIGNREEMVEELKKAAEEQKKKIAESYVTQLEQIESQIKRVKKEMEDADPEDEKGAQKRERRLKMLEQQQVQRKKMIEQLDQSFAVQNDEAVLSRMTRATGIAVSKQDVFVSLPKVAGYGYSIHRLDHDLENATIVVKNVGGCCGQLDIQSDGDNLLIAENTAFKVSIYDRDGNQQDSWGQRGRDKVDGFGSCCNPMNVRCCENGEILTAESSIGDIKRFSKDGEFLGLIGRASVGGGCKHVAIGWDTSRDWHYMMNQDKSSIAVLVPKDQAPAETDEEKASRTAMEGLGRKLLGTWEVAAPSASPVNKDADNPVVSGENVIVINSNSFISQSHGHLEFANDGSMIARPVAAPNAAVKRADLAVKRADPAVKREEQQEGAGVEAATPTILSFAIPADGGEANSDLPAAIAGSGLVITKIQTIVARKSTWKALRQYDEQLDFIMLEDDIEGMGGTVKWVNDEEIEVSWFHGSPANKMQHPPTRYKRISRNACGKSCDPEAGDTEKAVPKQDE